MQVSPGLDWSGAAPLWDRDTSCLPAVTFPLGTLSTPT
jgi:hypothetical protein